MKVELPCRNHTTMAWDGSSAGFIAHDLFLVSTSLCLPVTDYKVLETINEGKAV